MVCEEDLQPSEREVKELPETADPLKVCPLEVQPSADAGISVSGFPA